MTTFISCQELFDNNDGLIANISALSNMIKNTEMTLDLNFNTIQTSMLNNISGENLFKELKKVSLGYQFIVYEETNVKTSKFTYYHLLRFTKKEINEFKKVSKILKLKAFI